MGTSAIQADHSVDKNIESHNPYFLYVYRVIPRYANEKGKLTDQFLSERRFLFSLQPGSGIRA